MAGQDVCGSLKCDAFDRDQYSGGKGHHLRGATGRRVFGEELTVNFVDHAEVVSGYHKDGGLHHFTEAAAGFFQNDPDVLKSLSGLVFEVVADHLAGVEIVTGCAGKENEVTGDDGLGEGLAHAGGLGGIEVGLVRHMEQFWGNTLIYFHIIKYLFFIRVGMERWLFIYFRRG